MSAPASRRSRTIGAAGDRRSASSSAEHDAIDSGAAVITANGFSSRCFRERRRATARLVAREAGEVVAADALHGEHRSVPKERCGLSDGHGQLRPADGATRGLGVEPPVGRIVVLGAALPAHREPGHGRVATVVRHLPDDREPRTAVGAVDEGVVVTAVARVEELAEAGVAGGDVGWDESRSPSRAAWGDRKSRLARHRGETRRHPVDSCEARRVGEQRVGERVESAGLSFRLDQHSFAHVLDEPGQVVPVRQAVHERPEADALDDAPDDETATLPRRHAVSVATKRPRRKRLRVFHPCRRCSVGYGRVMNPLPVGTASVIEPDALDALIAELGARGFPGHGADGAARERSCTTT